MVTGEACAPAPAKSDRGAALDRLWSDHMDHLADPSRWAPPHKWAFLTYQRRWLYNRPKVKIYVKSRRIGITWATAYEAIEVASSRASAGGMDVFYMHLNRDDARKFIDTCAQWIRDITPEVEQGIEAAREHGGGGEHIGGVEVEESEDWFKDDDDEKILAYRITFPSGFSIYALPSKPSRLRGSQGFVIFDEAAYQVVKDLRKAATALLMWGGRIAYISTYNGVENGFYKYVQEMRRRNPDALHETDIFEACRQGLYQRICRVSGVAWSAETEVQWLKDLREEYGEDFDEELAILVDHSGGAIFPRELIEPCLTMGPNDCTIFELRGGSSPRLWIDGDGRGAASKSWEDGEGSATPEDRAHQLKRWMDEYLSPVLDKISKTGERTHVGGDYGRTGNLTAFTIATLTRTMRRRLRLVIEMENVPWAEQDALTDYLWPRLRNLRSGRTDGNGIGSNSAERCKVKSRGKIEPVNIQVGWHEPQFQMIKKRLQTRTIDLPYHHAPMVDDLVGMKRVRGKITAPETKGDRNQKRHADTAYSLALMEQSISTDPKTTTTQTAPRQRRRTRAPRGPRR